MILQVFNVTIKDIQIHSAQNNIILIKFENVFKQSIYLFLCQGVHPLLFSPSWQDALALLNQNNQYLVLSAFHNSTIECQGPYLYVADSIHFKRGRAVLQQDLMEQNIQNKNNHYLVFGAFHSSIIEHFTPHLPQVQSQQNLYKKYQYLSITLTC